MYNVSVKAEKLHKLVWMSRPLMQAAQACVEMGLEGTELTVRMRAVLEILQEHGALPVPEIAAKLEIKRQYVQVMVNETMAFGFTEQRLNPRHKRSPLIALTEKGEKLVQKVISRELELMREIGGKHRSQDISNALQLIVSVTQELKKRVGAEL